MRKNQLEDKLNNLYSKIKSLKLTNSEIAQINIHGLLYSTNRENVLQIVALFTSIARKHRVKIQKIMEDLL